MNARLNTWPPHTLPGPACGCVRLAVAHNMDASHNASHYTQMR